MRYSMYWSTFAVLHMYSPEGMPKLTPVTLYQYWFTFTVDDPAAVEVLKQKINLLKEHKLHTSWWDLNWSAADKAADDITDLDQHLVED